MFENTIFLYYILLVFSMGIRHCFFQSLSIDNSEKSQKLKCFRNPKKAHGK